MILTEDLRIGAYRASLDAFTPQNNVQQANKDLLVTLINLEDSVSTYREQIFELLNDTIADQDQQGMLDSLTRLSYEIPPDLQAALYALAGECLFEKGTCVITARSYFPDSIFYNPCEEFAIPSARYADTRLDDNKQKEGSYQSPLWDNSRRLVIVRQQVGKRPKATRKQLRLYEDNELFRFIRYVLWRIQASD